MGERKIDSFEFGSNLENETAWLHRIFSAVIKDDISLQAQMPTSGIPGQHITVEITGGNDKYSHTSAMLTDLTGAVAAYGKIGEPGIGSKTFTIPEDIAFGEYNLIVFGEQVNRARSIEYMTNVVTGKISLIEPIVVPEEAEPVYPDVEVMDIAGLNITRMQGSGELLQLGVKDGIVDIVLLADEGYFFPDDYGKNFNPTMLNGLSIVTIGDNMLTITGKPTESTRISLVPAVSKFFVISEIPDLDQTSDIFEGPLSKEDNNIDDDLIEDEVSLEVRDDLDESSDILIFLPDENNDSGEFGHMLDLDDDNGNSSNHSSSHFNADDEEEYVVVETYEATAPTEEDDHIENADDIGAHDEIDESNRTLIFLPDENIDSGELGNTLDLDDNNGNSYGHASSHFNADDEEEYVVIETYEATAMLEDDEQSATDEEVYIPEDAMKLGSQEGKSETLNRPGSLKYLGMTIISVAVVFYWQLKRRKK